MQPGDQLKFWEMSILHLEVGNHNAYVKINAGKGKLVEMKAAYGGSSVRMPFQRMKLSSPPGELIFVPWRSAIIPGSLRLDQKVGDPK